MYLKKWQVFKSPLLVTSSVFILSSSEFASHLIHTSSVQDLSDQQDKIKQSEIKYWALQLMG